MTPTEPKCDLCNAIWKRQKRTVFQSYLLIQRVEKHYRLHRLSQAHFISQDRICALSPGEPQPVQAFQLVGM